MQEHWILHRFSEFDHKPALIYKKKQYSYRELRKGCIKWIDELKERGISPGEGVAFTGDYSPERCMFLIALLVNRNIAVPLGRSENKNVEECLKESYASHFFDFKKDSNYQYRCLAQDKSHPLLEKLRDLNKAGLILFTSGSTGKPKVVLHNFNKILSKYQKSRKAYRVLVFLLIDHIGGINTLFRMLSSGSALIFEGARTPESICRAIEEYKVQLLPATPSFLRMLLISKLYEKFDLSSLEVISYGTEVMPESTLRALQKIFPKVEFKQTYGLSELGIFGTKSQRSDSLWLKIKGDKVDTKIVDGKLWIRSGEAMLGYLNAPSPFDEEGWFNTEDKVEVDGEYIRIKGRTNDDINVGGEKVHPSEVENVLMHMKNVSEAMVFGRSNPVLGNIVAAKIKLIEDEPLAQFEQRMREFCKDKLAPYQMPCLVEIVNEIPYCERFKKRRVKEVI